MIKAMSYEEILPVWQNFLWLERKDPIEPTSCMKYLGGYQQNIGLPAIYNAWIVDGEIVGVNSGHVCEDNSYRSRGLWVSEKMRGMGIGSKLLSQTIIDGYNARADFIWSFPRQTSWSTYERAGFRLVSEWSTNINNINAYCVLEYK